MSKIVQKEKVVVVIQGGNVVAAWSSIPEKSIELEIIDYDSRTGRKNSEEYLNKLIEDGVTPFELY